MTVHNTSPAYDLMENGTRHCRLWHYRNVSSNHVIRHDLARGSVWSLNLLTISWAMRLLPAPLLMILVHKCPWTCNGWRRCSFVTIRSHQLAQSCRDGWDIIRTGVASTGKESVNCWDGGSATCFAWQWQNVSCSRQMDCASKSTWGGIGRMLNEGLA